MLKILVTGAKGFVGRNLVETLKGIRDDKKRDTGIAVSEIYEYDLDSTAEDLDRFCRDCDFVFNLAGVNRPKDNSEFMNGNYGFASDLLEALKRNGNICPVMLSSSIQASLKGRFAYFIPVDDENSIIALRFYNRITGVRFINKIIARIGSLANKVVERQDKRIVETQLPKASQLRMRENLVACFLQDPFGKSCKV